MDLTAATRRFGPAALRDRLRQARLYRLGRTLYKQILEDDIAGLSAELAYRALLALFPFVIFAAALSGFATTLFDINSPTDRIINSIGDALPADAASVVRGQLRVVLESHNPSLLSTGLLGTLYAASGAVGTVMKAMNRIYRVPETRPFWGKQLVRLALTLLAGIATIAAFVLVIVGEVFGSDIADHAGLGSAYGTLVNLARWPLVLAAVLVAVSFVYWAAPNRKLPLRWTSAGALMFTLTWAVGTYLFSLYVHHYGSYSTTYGALGGFFILLVWFYLSSYVLFLGAELNRLLEKQAGRDGELSA